MVLYQNMFEKRINFKMNPLLFLMSIVVPSGKTVDGADNFFQPEGNQ